MCHREFGRMLCLLLTRFPGSTCSGGGGGRGAAVWCGDLQSRFDDEGGFLGPRAFPNAYPGKSKASLRGPLSRFLFLGRSVSLSGPVTSLKSTTKREDEAGEKECRVPGTCFPCPAGTWEGLKGGSNERMGGETNPFPITREWTGPSHPNGALHSPHHSSL